MKRLACLVVLVLVGGTVPAAWAGAAEEVQEAIEQTRRAWAAPTVEPLAALFAEDGVLTPAVSPFRIEGRKDIAAALAGFFKAFPTRRLVIRQPRTSIYNGNVAVVEAYWQYTAISTKGTVKTWRGRANVTRVKIGGQWLIVSQHSSLLPQ
ncbi:MAG: YybH family protein [Anaerolineae bacterium]